METNRRLADAVVRLMKMPDVVDWTLLPPGRVPKQPEPPKGLVEMEV